MYNVMPKLLDLYSKVKKIYTALRYLMPINLNFIKLNNKLLSIELKYYIMQKKSLIKKFLK